MLYLKTMLVPTKLTKLVYIMFIAMSVTVLSFRFIMLVIFELMPEVKYMFHCRNPTNIPIENTDGSLLFQTRKCEINNCYLSDRNRLLYDFTSFHVVLHDSRDKENIEDSCKFPRTKTHLIFGNCGYHNCPKLDMDKCLDMLAKEHFYFAFGTAMYDDYVMDIILRALQHDTVPVIFGGANYTRFLPDGSHSNALQYSPDKLVRRMFEIMENPFVYQMFFRRRNHYSCHAHSESPETDNYCRLCELVNDEDRYSIDALRVNFTEWWTLEGKCKNL